MKGVIIREVDVFFVYSSFIVRSSFDQVRGWLYGSWGVSEE